MVDKYKNVIMETLARVGDYMSFAELTRAIDDAGLEATGEWGLEHKERQNLVMWSGMSEKYKDAITSLLREGKIHAWPCDPLVYLFDGAMMQMPIAKKPPRSGYKKPHWLVVCLRPGQHPYEKEETP